MKSCINCERYRTINYSIIKLCKHYDHRIGIIVLPKETNPRIYKCSNHKDIKE